MAVSATLAGTPPVLEMTGIVKQFGATRALDDVELVITSGEIVGLLGANGSGKSTLIKILAGLHDADAGSVEIDGRALHLDGATVRRHGIRFVHQDLGLIETLTVVENLILGELSTERGLFIDWRRQRAEAQALFTTYGLDVSPNELVQNISPVDRAMLAIIRAVRGMTGGDVPAGATDGSGTGLLVLDEPTVFLSGNERALLFRLVRRLAGDGVAVLFVSHDLDEVRDLCSRAVVLRSGRLVGSFDLEDMAEEELVRHIVGGELAHFEKDIHTAGKDSAHITVRDLGGEGIGPMNLDLARGEIVGLTGLAGSGFEAAAYLLFGAKPATSGRLRINGVEYDVPTMSPANAIRVGMALVPADRATGGIVADLSLAENLSLPALRKFAPGGFIRTGRLRIACAEILLRFGVVPSAPDRLAGTLSGGNQQKAVVAKWLSLSPILLLLVEPTQGVDVGARQDIFRLLQTAADDGVTVLCASTETEQLSQLCDRVIVFRSGRPVRELIGDQVDKNVITHACVASA